MSCQPVSSAHHHHTKRPAERTVNYWCFNRLTFIQLKIIIDKKDSAWCFSNEWKSNNQVQCTWEMRLNDDVCDEKEARLTKKSVWNEECAGVWWCDSILKKHSPFLAHTMKLAHVYRRAWWRRGYVMVWNYLSFFLLSLFYGSSKVVPRTKSRSWNLEPFLVV